MNYTSLKQGVSFELDAELIETQELYAEHCAQKLDELGEVLCLAIIRDNGPNRSAHTARSLQMTISAVEAHVERSRGAFVESLAFERQCIADHDAQCRAELNIELRRA